MVKKILVVLLNIILTFSIIYTFTFQCNAAFDVGGTFGGAISSDAEDAQNATIEIIGAVLTVIRTACAGIAVVILLVIGCKYMLASAGDRADIKKYAINYVIGAFILFGATALVSIAKIFVDSALTVKK